MGVFEIDDKDITPTQDVKIRARTMANDFGWQVGDARKIWSFGVPPDSLPNTIVDAAKGVQFLNEIKDHVGGAFMQAAGSIICDEAWRGIRMNIDDVTLHADAIHRGAGQIMPAAKKVNSNLTWAELLVLFLETIVCVPKPFLWKDDKK